jgi:hypothetical protein
MWSRNSGWSQPTASAGLARPLRAIPVRLSVLRNILKDGSQTPLSCSLGITVTVRQTIVSHGSTKSRRPPARARRLSRCSVRSSVRQFRLTSPPNSAPLGGRGHFDGFCDEEAVPLICLPCQVSAQSVGAGDGLLLCMGLFSIFLARAAATRRDRQNIPPEGAHAGEAFAATKWRARHDSNV